MESQGILLAQTPWASARAERSRVAKYQGDSQNTSTMLTWEEELLSEMLGANEALFGALKLYDDLVPIEPEVRTDRLRATFLLNDCLAPATDRGGDDVYSRKQQLATTRYVATRSWYFTNTNVSSGRNTPWAGR